jgi:surfeit locus 1 family protein
MQTALRHQRSTAKLITLLIAAAFAFTGFCTLGIWQVHRLAWKEALIAQVDRQVHSAPVPAPGPEAWPALTREHDEYRRVMTHGRFDHEHETLVRASTALGAGYWVLTPLRTDDGFWLLVNRGFVPPEQKDRASRHASEPADAEIVGLLRFSEPGGSLLQHNEPPQGRWYSRDVSAIAAAQHLGGAVVAPYFVDAQADEATKNAWPRPGLTVLHFSNNHLIYAVTWFALAAMTACAIGYLVIDERRLRRLAAGARPLVVDRAH